MNGFVSTYKQKIQAVSTRGSVVTPRGTVLPRIHARGNLRYCKGLDPARLSALGAGILLGNTYHLMNRPGHERVRALGGLHKMMSWDAHTH